MSNDVHVLLRAISFEISQPSATKISLNIIFLRFYWNLPGANELNVRIECKIFRHDVFSLLPTQVIISFYIHVYVQWAIIFNTLRPRQNGRHFANDIFKCNFVNEKAWFSITISLKFVPQDPVNNIPTLVEIMAWRRPNDKPFLNLWRLDYRRIYASLALNELILLRRSISLFLLPCDIVLFLDKAQLLYKFLYLILYKKILDKYVIVGVCALSYIYVPL